MKEHYSGSYERISTILDELREKCPWDRKQDIHSLRSLTIEETYELADAIHQEDWDGIKEELGDLLLHILFYAKIASEKGHFGMKDVLQGLCTKLVHRHPHIYETTEVADDEEVKKNWEQLKLKEGKESILSGVPTALPAMIKSLRLQEKASQVGFEWEKTSEVREKVEEEWQELKDVENSDHSKKEDELGDVLFSMINYSRFLNVDPETALERTNKKFIKRFQAIETVAKKEEKSLEKMTLEEMDNIWNLSKEDE